MNSTKQTKHGGLIINVIDESAKDEIDDSDVVYEITTYGADFDVNGLVSRVDKQHIFRPEFQRQYVWTHKAASRFVESILLGLPIPSVFLYKDEETQRLLIVDGLQRLTTLHAFKKGFLPNSDRKFKLIEVKERFKNLTYETLDPVDQIRFDDSIIHAMIIQQTSPQNDKTAIYHIFDRLNSNGTPLQPQEMRIAIFDGPFIRLLSELNKSDAWRKLFGKVHKRSKDQELILRFLAFYFDLDGYSSPVNKFLNDFTNKSRHIDPQETEKYAAAFNSSIDRITSAIGASAFRPSRSINAAIFDSFLVAVARNPNASNDQIKTAYKALILDEEYMDYVTSSTSDRRRVEGRFRMAMERLNDLCD